MSLRLLPRRHLSPRYLQIVRRNNSTSPPITETTVPPPHTPPPKPSSTRTYLIASTIALALGYGVGSYACHLIAPPPLPEAGTHEDTVLLADLNKRLDEEFKVKVLRGKCLGVTKQLKGEEGGWVEIVSEKEKGPGNGGTMMHSLRAAKNLGVERVFWDRGERRMVAIVHFGPDLTGWPGVTHGGLLATALTEKIALANSLAEGKVGYSPSAIPQRLPGTGDHAKMPLPEVPPHEPAQLSIDYVKPTYANSFHVIRVSPSIDSDDEAVRLPIKGFEWKATLETMDARVCVKANAKFESRGLVERVEERVLGEGKRWTYEDFKEWMWPSRQRESHIG